MTIISEVIIPVIIVSIIGMGLYKKVPVYDTFIEGAKKGFTTVLHIMPTLIGLMVAVGILRASGFLDMLADILGQFTQHIGFPA